MPESFYDLAYLGDILGLEVVLQLENSHLFVLLAYRDIFLEGGDAKVAPSSLPVPVGKAQGSQRFKGGFLYYQLIYGNSRGVVLALEHG